MNCLPPGDAQPACIAAVAAELGLDTPVVTPLAGGRSNRTFRLTDVSHDLVLRVAGTEAGAFGVDHQAELAMLRLAAPAGLAPPVALARPGEGLLVTHFVGGRVLARDDARQPATLARIGGWFARLHVLEPPAGVARIDIAARAAAYLGALRAQGPSALVRELELRLARLRGALRPPRRLTACHHDLHHLNLVDTGESLVALDWEYAGPGDPAADLAACVCYHDLDPEQCGALLGGYRVGSRSLVARLGPLCWVFDCLWYGWIEIAATRGIAPDAQRRQQLIDRLMA